MRLKPFLRNLVKPGLLFSLCLGALLVFGCTSSTQPTYLKENINEAIQNVCKTEYNLDVKARLIGSTVWIYLPLEDILEGLTGKKDKAEKYLEKFAIEDNKVGFKDETLNLNYLIKAIPEQEKQQEIGYSKSALDKISSVWRVIRRVIFSMEETKKDSPQFFCLITADIKNGFFVKVLFYYLDLKKVSYQFISWTEYQHRTIQDMEIAPQIIGDKEGLHLDYHAITWKEFIASQIQQRIKLKFQKPEVDKNADIDKEILKIVIYTIKTYGFMDFSDAELNNLITQNKIVLNRQALWSRPLE